MNPILVIEQDQSWARPLRCLLSTRFQVIGQSPEFLPDANFEDYGCIVISNEKSCLDRWVSLFDKQGGKLENLRSILVGAISYPIHLSFYRELGFSEVVTDLMTLESVVDYWRPMFESGTKPDLKQHLLSFDPWSGESWSKPFESRGMK